MLTRFLAWWRREVFPCWVECYPEGWRSRTGIGMTCEECNRYHEIEDEMRQRRAAEAARLVTRPEYV